MKQDFSQNLRLLCSYYKSVAEVCRKMDINRAQFNRYLSGRYQPSANIQQRIGDFFGFEVYELYLPHNQFAQLVKVRPKSEPEKQNSRAPYQSHIEHLQRLGDAGLERYLGFYFEIYPSMAYRGKVLRSLVHLGKMDGSTYFQRTERLEVTEPEKEVFHSKYLGLAFMLADRIFLLDYESLTGSEITQTVLYPSFRSRVTRLQGIKTGVSASDKRLPASTRVVYEYLGEKINTRKAIRMCGLFDLESEEFTDDVRQALKNDIAEDELHFNARVDL